MADVITGTQVLNTRQDLIAELVQRELQFNAKLVPTVLDVSPFAVPGAKSISFPKFDSVTVTNRTIGSAGAASALTSSLDQLNLDKIAYSAFLIDSVAELQSNVNLMIEFAKRHGAAHGRYVDSQIIAELENVGVATTTAGDITRDIFLEMRQKLVERHAILENCYFVCSPDQEAKMLAIDTFTRADIYGSSNIPSGVIGKLFGINVIVHAGLSAQTYYMYEKEGIAIGFQQELQMSEQPANEYGVNAVRVAMERVFGVKGMQIAQAGAPAGKSALVIKDNN